MKLTNEDVQEIVRLLDSSGYGELRLETDSFTLTLRRTADGDWSREHSVTREPVVDGATTATPAIAAPTAVDTVDADDASLVAVRAPLPGTFYRAPRPGAAPFVEVGSAVEPATVIGIIETMKLMNSVHAGTSGVIERICVGNAQPAERDAVLMCVRVTRA
jgi:acetyl-CoA carboxylase biotin carboxyl carrier protein